MERVIPNLPHETLKQIAQYLKYDPIIETEPIKFLSELSATKQLAWLDGHRQALMTEISSTGGHSIANLLRGGHGVPYATLVYGLTQKLQIECEPTETVEAMEKRIIVQVWKSITAKMSPEERRELEKKIEERAAELGKKISSNLAGFGALSAAQLSGFGVYMLGSTLLGGINGALGLGLGFGVFTGLSKAIALAIGPLGWGVLGIATIAKLGSPNYKKLLPVVFMIATHRAETSEAQSHETTILQCPSPECGTNLRIPAETLPQGLHGFRCPKCKTNLSESPNPQKIIETETQTLPHNVLELFSCPNSDCNTKLRVNARHTQELSKFRCPKCKTRLSESPGPKKKVDSSNAGLPAGIPEELNLIALEMTNGELFYENLSEQQKREADEQHKEREERTGASSPEPEVRTEPPPETPKQQAVKKSKNTPILTKRYHHEPSDSKRAKLVRQMGKNYKSLVPNVLFKQDALERLIEYENPNLHSFDKEFGLMNLWKNRAAATIKHNVLHTDPTIYQLDAKSNQKIYFLYDSYQNKPLVVLVGTKSTQKHDYRKLRKEYSPGNKGRR